MAPTTLSSPRHTQAGTRRHKVLYVITRAEHGGAQTHVFRLAASLNKHFEVEVATGEEGFLTHACREQNIPVHIIPHLQREIRPLQDVRALWELYRVVRAVKPDLIHTHTFKAGFLGRLIAHALNIPSIYTLHSWLFGTAAMPGRWSLFAVPCERLGAMLCDRIITISGQGEQLLRSRLKRSASKITTICNGIPDCEERRQVGGGDTVNIIMVARFTKVKEFDVLLRAFARLPSGTRLVLVGDGVTRGDCEALASELGIADRVDFLGSRDDVASLLAASDIFVLASKCEMSPISILEAMRAGLPVIASDVGSTGEMIDETGLLVPSSSVDELERSLTKLIEDRELRIRLGRAARLRFEQHYKFGAQVELTSALYMKVLSIRTDKMARDALITFTPARRRDSTSAVLKQAGRSQDMAA